MSNPTFTPGQRVSDTGKNITGTVADDPKMRREYPGMVPVHWDNGDRSVASPSILAPAPWGDIETWDQVRANEDPAPAGLEAFTDAEIQAELDRRKDEAYEAARVTAGATK